MPPRRRNIEDAFERQPAPNIDLDKARGNGKRAGNYKPWNKKYNTEEEKREAKRARDNARNARKRNQTTSTPRFSTHNENISIEPGKKENIGDIINDAFEFGRSTQKDKYHQNRDDIKNRLTIAPSVTAKAPDTRDVTLTINKGDTFNTFDTDGVIYRVSPPINDSKTYRVAYDTVHNLGTFSKEPASLRRWSLATEPRTIAPYDSHSTPKIENIGTKGPKKDYPVVKDLPQASKAKPSIKDEVIRVEEVESHQLPRRHDFFDDLRRNYNRRVNKRKEAVSREGRSRPSEEDAAERAAMNTISEEPLNITSNDIFDSNLQADHQRLPKQTMTTETGQNPKLNITKPTVIYDRTDTMNEFKDINPSLPTNADTNTINEFYKNSRWNNKNNIRSMYTRDHFSRNNAVISTIAKMRYLNAMRQQTDEIRASKRYKPYKSYRRKKHRKH